MRNTVKQSYSPIIRLAVLSMFMCGLLFPLLVTGLAQVFMPSQANGSLVHLNGRNVGSDLIAQNFSQPVFFHPRNNSASGVDPHITLQDAYSQIPRIHNATCVQITTCVPSTDLADVVNGNIEGAAWISDNTYVNVLRLNLILIQKNPKGAYNSFK